MTKKTRLYEVPVATAPGDFKTAKTYLVEASHPSAAERHVTRKFVGEAKIADGVRVSVLMGEGVKPEKAEEATGP